MVQMKLDVSVVLEDSADNGGHTYSRFVTLSEEDSR